MDQNKLSLYATQAQTNVSFTSFMTAVVVFFTGLLIASFDKYNILIKIPISFLIISIFGFLYSTLIFANATGKIVNGDEKSFKRHMFLGDVISEYLGVYLLVFSIPLVIGVITQDNFVRIISILSALIGLAVYQFSSVSIMEKHFNLKHKFFAKCTLLIGTLLLIAQFLNYYFILISVLFLIWLMIITFLSIRWGRGSVK